mgnify:CR=1 FL=1
MRDTQLLTFTRVTHRYSDGVIWTPPRANHRCAVPVVSVAPIPGIRTSTSASNDPR